MSEINHDSYNKILLVEDNPGDARLVELYLEESDLFQFNIIHCSNLKDGMEALSAGEFAAVLLDIHLPDSRGFKTLETLLASYPEENVIVLTGLSDKSLGLRAVQTGAQDYLVKGEFDPELLSKTLKYSIERNRIIKRLEEAQRITHIGHWELDLQSKVFDASDEVYRIFGISESIVNYDLAMSFIHPDDVGFVKQILQKLHTQKEVSQDLRIIRRDDSNRYISVLARPVQIIEGKVMRISGVVQDITERKLADEEILKGKARYESIFNQSKDAIFVRRKSGELVDFNTATVDLFGYTEDELRKMDTKQLYLDKSEREKFDEKMEKEGSVKDFRIDFVQKNGDVRNCLVTASMTISEEFTGYHGIVRDITDRMQAEQLRKDKEIAEHSARLKEKFLANVSHEMRTPMNGIMGMSNLLLKEKLYPKQLEYVNFIQDSSEYLLGIINDILDIAKSEYDEIEFESAEFNLKHIINTLHKSIRIDIQSKKKNLKFDVHIADDVKTNFIGDHLRLNQILLNLTSNAVKFTEQGTISLTVNKLEETEEETKLRFEVKDSGIGMTEDQLDVIFEPFTRVASNKEKLYEGTGLGLSIVKRFVELQGGRIYVSSELGKGSVFGFELSLKNTTNQSTIEPVKVEEDFFIPDDQKVNILVVEDNTINQTVARNTIIKQWPHVSVEVADNGQIAINKFNENDYDLILMDIQMPIMDGEEATKHIRNHFPEPKRSIPIIAMTAHVHIKTDQKFIEFDMDDCVLKPFQPAELFSVITKYVKSKEFQSTKQNETLMGIDQQNYQFIDLSYLELMSDGDLDMKGVLLEMLLSDPAKEVERMKSFTKEKNWEEVKLVSHKMKTSFPYIGYKKLIDTNVLIDSKLFEWQSGDISDEDISDTIPNLVHQVDHYLQEAVQELKVEFSQLKSGAV